MAVTGPFRMLALGCACKAIPVISSRQQEHALIIIAVVKLGSAGIVSVNKLSYF
jgi:hypothetical protein